MENPEKFPFRLSFLVLSLLLLTACGKPLQEENQKKVTIDLSDIQKLKSLHKQLSESAPGDWTYMRSVNHQSFEDYVANDINHPNANRNKIYLLPIGIFDTTDMELITFLKDYITAFYGQEVVLQSTISDSIASSGASRTWKGVEQLHTEYIMMDILQNRMPSDAVAYLAITSKDLYPKNSWNYVFGKATLNKRLGVASLFRFRPNSKDKASLTLYRNRVMKTVTHELGHMFSLKHCSSYKCLMNGSKTLSESDSKPTWLCHECLEKMIWCTKQDITDRYDALIHICQDQGYELKEAFYKRSKEILNK